MGEAEQFQAIACRFILCLPRQEVQEPTRLCYHAEKAFFFYIDEVLKTKPRDWDRQRNQFLFKLKQYLPASFVKFNPQLMMIKMTINKPVCGIIVFSKDNSKVLVIRVRGKLGFPKGKLNQSQLLQDCAIREVIEETGINVSGKLDSKVRIQFENHGSNTFFFVARGVSEKQRIKVDGKQIDGVQWIKIEDVARQIGNFVERSRIAWGIYDRDYSRRNISPQFVPKYFKKDWEPFDHSLNPLRNFQLDRKLLMNALLS